MKRRIKKANITFVSLCPQGKNKMPTIYKDDGTIEFATLLKDSDLDDKGEVVAVVYAPEVRDSDGDVASPEVIKQMAYDYMRDGGQLDVRHDGKALPKEKAFIAETFLIQKADPRFQDMKTTEDVVVDVTGGWAMVIKVDDPELRKSYRDGGWGGVSIFGQAQVEVESAKAAGDETVNRIIKALAKRLEGGNSEEEIEMTQEELVKALGENNKALITGLTDVLKPKPKGEGDSDGTGVSKEIKFEGDPTSQKDVEAHLAKIEKAKILKDTDFSDPEAVKKLLADNEPGDEPGESDEVKDLRKRLEKALGKSGQPGGKGGKGGEEDTVPPTGLSKEEADNFAIGRKMGQHINRVRGYADKQ